MTMRRIALGRASLSLLALLGARAGAVTPAATAPAAAKVEELTYTDAAGQPRKATLVLPGKGSPRAGVLFAHWLGEPPKNDRGEFLDDATALAADGIASLTVDHPWKDESWFEKRKLAEDEGFSDAEVRELKHELDTLVARLPTAGAPRLGFVGHDFGGMYGALMVAGEPRISTAVFMAATPIFADWFLLGQNKLPAAEKDAYRKKMARFDLPGVLASRTAPLATLLQFAKGDRYIPDAAANQLVAAVPEPKVVQWYDDDHRLGNEKAAEARRQFLREHLLAPAASR